MASDTEPETLPLVCAKASGLSSASPSITGTRCLILATSYPPWHEGYAGFDLEDRVALDGHAGCGVGEAITLGGTKDARLVAGVGKPPTGISGTSNDRSGRGVWEEG